MFYPCNLLLLQVTGSVHFGPSFVFAGETYCQVGFSVVYGTDSCLCCWRTPEFQNSDLHSEQISFCFERKSVLILSGWCLPG